MKTIYADAVSNMSLTEGVVRFDLLSFSKIEGDKGELAVNSVIAMSLPALLRTHQNLHQAFDKMVEKGLLQKSASGETP